MRTLENVFHLKCFACVVCGVQLKKGEQYVVKQGQLFCRFDYEREVEMLQGYGKYADSNTITFNNQLFQKISIATICFPQKWMEGEVPKDREPF